MITIYKRWMFIAGSWQDRVKVRVAPNVQHNINHEGWNNSIWTYVLGYWAGLSLEKNPLVNRMIPFISQRLLLHVLEFVEKLKYWTQPPHKGIFYICL